METIVVFLFIFAHLPRLICHELWGSGENVEVRMRKMRCFFFIPCQDTAEMKEPVFMSHGVEYRVQCWKGRAKALLGFLFLRFFSPAFEKSLEPFPPFPHHCSLIFSLWTYLALLTPCRKINSFCSIVVVFQCGFGFLWSCGRKEGKTRTKSGGVPCEFEISGTNERIKKNVAEN